MLREVCGDRALAERIRAFLERYSTGFYNYYQVILGLSIGDPVYSIEEVVADNVPVGEKTVVVKHVRIGDRILGDWYLYGDRLVYDALASLYRGHRERALEDLRRLENLTDQYGVRDMVQKIKGLYETYKLALAVVLYRALGDERGDERYIEKLYSINPFTTLYRDGFRGEGDLNVETAALTAIALHTTPRPPGQAQMLLMTLATVIVATGAALATAIALRRRKSRHSL